MYNPFVCQQIANELEQINPGETIIAATLDGKSIILSTKQAIKLNLPEGYSYENGFLIRKSNHEDEEANAFPFYSMVCRR